MARSALAVVRGRARVRPRDGLVTPAGRWLLVLGAASLGVGAWLNWQEFVQLGVVALLLVLVAVGWVWLPGRPQVEVSVSPARITVGRDATVHVAVRNGLVPLLHPVVEVPVDAGAVVAVRLPVLRPHARWDEPVPLPPQPRGVWTVGPGRYDRSDALGLARRRLGGGDGSQLWVRPEVVSLELLTSGATTDLEGTTSERLTMSDLAFHALREYRPGDDLRHVHWRSSAKADQLLVRQYHETRRGHVTVLLDPDPGSYPQDADFELAVSVATSVGLRAVRDGLDTLLRCGDEGGAAAGPEQVLDLGCRFRRQPADHGAAAHAAATAVPGTGLVVQVTGVHRKAPELRAAAARFNREAAQVIVRADTRGQARVSNVQGIRELTVSELRQLPGLLAGSLR